MVTKSSRWSFLRKRRWQIVAAVLAVVLVVGALELTNTTYLFHSKKVPKTIPVSTPKKPSKQDQKKSSGKSSDDKSAGDSEKIASSAGGSTGANAPLLQPYGTLVSNHFPGKNGSGTQVQSTCNTTPGASCYIQFTNTGDGKVTKLPPQTVGSDGSTTWSWNADILTSGTWRIEAIANLGGQTKSVTDSMNLEIQ